MNTQESKIPEAKYKNEQEKLEELICGLGYINAQLYAFRIQKDEIKSNLLPLDEIVESQKIDKQKLCGQEKEIINKIIDMPYDKNTPLPDKILSIIADYYLINEYPEMQQKLFEKFGDVDTRSFARQSDIITYVTQDNSKSIN